MSLATLKKKTFAKYNIMSVGSKNGGFSLNGTRRSQGYVGQTMLGRHFPSTPMRGNVARGSGGCCGHYLNGTIVQSGVCFPTNPIDGSSANNNPNIVKRSVLETRGHIQTKYRWVRRGYPYSTVKPDATLDNNSQQEYIENLSTKTVACLKGSYTIEGPVVRPVCINRTKPFGTTIRVPKCWRPFTKTPEYTNKLGAIQQGKFIQALSGLCKENDVKPTTVNNCCVLPGPGALY